MAVHRFQTADGKVHRIEAPNRAAAEAELNRVIADRDVAPKGGIPVLGDFARAIGQAKDATFNEYKRQVATAQPGAKRSMVDDLMSVPRMAGALMQFPGAATEAVTRPIARAATIIPGTNAADNNRIINTALMGLRPSPAKLAPSAGVKPPPRASAAIPKTEAKAARYVQRLAKSGGVDVAALDAAPADITAAEALGRSGKTGLGALARREGGTGDALDAIVAERQITRPTRILDEFTRATGVSPEAAAGNIEQVVKQGRAAAEPLYTEAYDAGPVMTPKLGELLSRPSMRGAMTRARALAAEEGINPDDLGLVDVEVPGAWDSFVGMMGSAPDLPTRGPARAPSRGYSLAQFVGRNGGIADEAGELANIGADRWHVGRPYQHSLVGSGNADDMALRAWEAGYFPELTRRPTINEFYNALGDEMRGRARFAREADPAVRQRFDASRAAEEFNARGGVGPDDLGMMPDDVEYGAWRPDGDDYVGASRPGEGYVGRPEPMSEPAWEVQPTAQTWDYVKRGLDDVIKSYEDKTTGRLVLDGQGRATLDTLKALRRELIKANPAYGRALETSSDYLSASKAFKDGEKFLFNQNVTERDFAEKLGKLTGGSLDAWRGGIGNKLFNLAQNGKLDPKLFKAPRVQAKLRMALGDEASRRLLEMIQAEGQKLGFERRYAPGANSITAEIRAAMGEQDELGSMHQAMDDFLSNIHRGPGGAIGSAIAGAAKKGAAIARTPGMSVGVRDEAGRLLTMSPQDLAAYIRSLPPPKPLLNERGRRLIGRSGATTAGESAPTVGGPSLLELVAGGAIYNPERRKR